MLAKFVSKKTYEWSSYLDTCVFAYNTSRHESSKYPPFTLMFGRQATLPIDVELSDAGKTESVPSIQLNIPKMQEERIKLLDQAKSNILQAQKKQKELFDKKNAKPLHYSVGQLVLKKDFTRTKSKGGKLKERYTGPYEITQAITRGVFQLKGPNDQVLRATGAHLKKYISPQYSLDDRQSTLTSGLSYTLMHVLLV